MRTRLICLGAAAVWLAALAFPTWARNNSCLFQAAGGLSLSFGALDPSNAVAVTVSAAAVSLNSNHVGDCRPTIQTMTISGDNGLNFGGGSRRLRSASGSFIPYSLTALPITRSRPGNNNYVMFTFNGVIAAAAYQNAPAGTYTDTITISVNP